MRSSGYRFEWCFIAFICDTRSHIHAQLLARTVKGESIESKTQSTGIKYPLNLLVFIDNFDFFVDDVIIGFNHNNFFNDFFDVAAFMLICISFLFLFVYCFGWCVLEDRNVLVLFQTRWLECIDLCYGNETNWESKWTEKNSVKFAWGQILFKRVNRVKRSVLLHSRHKSALRFVCRKIA